MKLSYMSEIAVLGFSLRGVCQALEGIALRLSQGECRSSLSIFKIFDAFVHF